MRGDRCGEGKREKERGTGDLKGTERKRDEEREACEEQYIKYGNQNLKSKCSRFGKQRMLLRMNSINLDIQIIDLLTCLITYRN